jgi:NTP pyrophosphatase (non-canonical NTP hydrolase)
MYDSIIADIQKQCMEDSIQWFPNAANDLTALTLGVCGESGEFADIVKKVARGSLILDDAVPKLQEELIDIFIYVMNLAELLCVDVVAQYVDKREKNIARFGSRKEDTNGH